MQETERRLLETKHRLNTAIRAHHAALDKLTRLQNQASFGYKWTKDPHSDCTSIHTRLDSTRVANPSQKRPKLTSEANASQSAPSRVRSRDLGKDSDDFASIGSSKLVWKASMFPYLFGGGVDYQRCMNENVENNKKARL